MLNRMFLYLPVSFTNFFIIFALPLLFYGCLSPEACATPMPTALNKLRLQKELSINKQPEVSDLDYASMYFYEGVKYCELGHWQEAIIAYKGATTLRQDYKEAYFGLGMAYYNLGNWNDALAAYQMAVKISPEYAEGYFGLGMACAMLGRNIEAVEAHKQASRIDPEYAEAHFALALDFLLMGDSGSALQEYEILKTLDEDLAIQLINIMQR